MGWAYVMHNSEGLSYGGMTKFVKHEEFTVAHATNKWNPVKVEKQSALI